MPPRIARPAALAAYVLHRYDWSESSLVLDVFTREQGRIAVVAKGAKRPFSQLRSVLLPFQRVSLMLGRESGDDAAREVQSLRGADWQGGSPMLTGAALFNGFYLNELLMKLLARHDPHPLLFDAYGETVVALGAASARDAPIGDDGQPALRAFELVLLREIGLLPDLGVETAAQRPVERAQRYRVLADSGVVAAPGAEDGATAGTTLLGLQSALDARDLSALRRAAAAARGELRPLLRGLLHYHLGDDALRTRRVLREAQDLEA